MPKPVREKPPAQPKSATITLRAHGATMLLAAVRRPDGTAVTSVTTRNADKHATRGMTETHANLDAARTHLAKLAQQAEKLGWKRGARVGATKPDAFSTLPAPPKESVKEAAAS